MIRKGGCAFLAGYRNESRGEEWYKELMIGAQGNGGDSPWEDIEDNNLAFFPDVDTCTDIASEYLNAHTDCAYVEIVHVDLLAAKHPEELHQFEEKSNLVTIARSETNGQTKHYFFGPIHGSRPHSPEIRAAKLHHTNYETYDEPNGNLSPFKRAQGARHQILSRGIYDHATIGEINVERIERINRDS